MIAHGGLAGFAFFAPTVRAHHSGTWHLSELNLRWVGAAVAALAVWYGVVLVARWVTRPAMPKGAPATMDLRPESPALVEFLVGEWEPGRSAVVATLIDLAARHLIEFQQVGQDPKSTVIRVPQNAANGVAAPRDVPLLPYEQRVLHRVQALATGGVVPAGALAQGTEAQDRAWWKAFAKQVVADAKQRGLSRDRFRPALRLVLAVLALGPAVLVAAAVFASGGRGDAPFAAAGAVFLVALAVVGALQGQRETPDGRAACAHWLGVRAWLGADEVFPTLPPASVTMWDRYLAYGAAVGVARTASATLPFGPRDEHRAWSTFGGAWHEVRLRYQPVRRRRLRHPGWTAVGAAFWAAAWSAAIKGLIVLDGRSYSAIPRATESLVLFGAGVAAGLIALRNFLILIAASHDLLARAEITGEVVRLRHVSGEDRNTYHAAIDPGGVRRVLAWPLRYEVYQKLNEGDTVKAVRGSWSGYTYSIDVTTASGRGRVFEADGEALDSAAADGAAALFTAPVPDPGDLVPCDEAAAILGVPLTERAQASTPTLPVFNARVRIYQTTRGANGSNGSGRVVVQSATGPVARRLFSVFARNGQPLPGLGEEAYTRDQTVAVRRGETIVIIRVAGAIAADAPQRLASAAVARL